MATINDVAKHAGVSPTTAKRAIREPNKLSPKTLKRVLAAVEALEYEPDQLASALRSGHSQTIGLIIGSIVESFFAQMTRVIGERARNYGYSVVIADNEYSAALELDHLKQFAGHRVAGIIMRSGYGTSNVTYLERLQRRDIALVEFDHHHPESPFSHVMLDNERCVRKGLSYLHSLGHTRIAALGSFDELILPDERCSTYPKVMASLGLAVPKLYQRVIKPTEKEAYQLTHTLMRLAEPPTALFALTGNMAIGAFRALQELGLCIPEDVSLISFDDYLWTRLVTPPITVIAQPVEVMAQAAVDTLVQAIKQNQNGQTPVVIKQRFDGELLIRQSCAVPKDRDMSS